MHRSAPEPWLLPSSENGFVQLRTSQGPQSLRSSRPSKSDCRLPRPLRPRHGMTEQHRARLPNIGGWGAGHIRLPA